MKTWIGLIGLFLATVAHAGTVSIDLTPITDTSIVMSLTADGDVEGICALQAFLEWAPPDSEIGAVALQPYSMFGFPLTGEGAVWNADLRDGDAAIVWTCSFDNPDGFDLMDQRCLSIAELTFDPVMPDLTLTLGDPSGIQTRVVVVGGDDVWDGVIATATIPEPTTLALLAVGLLMRRR